MPVAEVRDGEIYYEEVGSGMPLIFVSGFVGVARYWAPQAPFFASRFRVITYDQRGTGQSDRKQHEFSVDQMAIELAELMSILSVERAHIVGISTGGAIGQALAIDYPSLVARLVVCSTWTHCDPWRRRLFEARREMLRQCDPELSASFNPLWLYPPDYINAHDVEIEREVRLNVATSPPREVLIGRINALLAFDRRAGHIRINAPTLVIASDNDYITPVYYAKSLANSIPNAQLRVIEGGGHSVSKTKPDQFNRAVLSFLMNEEEAN